MQQTRFITGGSAAQYPIVVKKIDLFNQSANIAFTTLYSVPSGAAGRYRINGYAVITQAATTSSTFPAILIRWTDQDTNFVPPPCQLNGGVNTGNIVGTNSIQDTMTGATAAIAMDPYCAPNVKDNTNIQYGISNYNSTGATPMQYALHLTVEYLGP